MGLLEDLVGGIVKATIGHTAGGVAAGARRSAGLPTRARNVKKALYVENPMRSGGSSNRTSRGPENAAQRPRKRSSSRPSWTPGYRGALGLPVTGGRPNPLSGLLDGIEPIADWRNDAPRGPSPVEHMGNSILNSLGYVDEGARGVKRMNRAMDSFIPDSPLSYRDGDLDVDNSKWMDVALFSSPFMKASKGVGAAAAARSAMAKPGPTKMARRDRQGPVGRSDWGSGLWNVIRHPSE